ncbi:MAG: hypothetical protein IPI67_00050 [Myxococcales bacterium]|nr:hypothetical protein [Myxococcales bacterium]
MRLAPLAVGLAACGADIGILLAEPKRGSYVGLRDDDPVDRIARAAGHRRYLCAQPPNRGDAAALIAFEINNQLPLERRLHLGTRHRIACVTHFFALALDLGVHVAVRLIAVRNSHAVVGFVGNTVAVDVIDSGQQPGAVSRIERHRVQAGLDCRARTWVDVVRIQRIYGSEVPARCKTR